MVVCKNRIQLLAHRVFCTFRTKNKKKTNIPVYLSSQFYHSFHLFSISILLFCLSCSFFFYFKPFFLFSVFWRNISIHKHIQDTFQHDTMCCVDLNIQNLHTNFEVNNVCILRSHRLFQLKDTEKQRRKLKKKKLIRNNSPFK